MNNFWWPWLFITPVGLAGLYFLYHIFRKIRFQLFIQAIVLMATPWLLYLLFPFFQQKDFYTDAANLITLDFGELVAKWLMKQIE